MATDAKTSVVLSPEQHFHISVVVDGHEFSCNWTWKTCPLGINGSHVHSDWSTEGAICNIRMTWLLRK